MQWAPGPDFRHSAPDVPLEAGGPGWPAGDSRSAGDRLGGQLSPQWSHRDPRTSSTQSLVSSAIEGDRKRKLLVVYIHGFMGNNSSFRSFPAHVHNLLKNLLAESHTIHTKIYPRYKTYKSIDVACENFSKWLAPHESPTTDVILVGHSMGGLLAADVALLPSQSPYNAASPFRHRILGTISLDAPLLGLHPGIVVSGIASLFRTAPSLAPMDEDTQVEYGRPSKPNTLSPDPEIYSKVSPQSGAPSPNPHLLPPPSTTSPLGGDGPDPYFNPPFPNDVAFVDRGWFSNIVNFAIKHKEENLLQAAASHIISHLEFGGCLADYRELRARYKRLRELEDGADWGRPGAVRVRFVNYYTVSTGVKKPRSPSPADKTSGQNAHGHSARSSLELDTSISRGLLTEESRVPTPRISIEKYAGEPRRESLESLQILEPIPEPERDFVLKREAEQMPEPKQESGPGPEPEPKPEPEPEKPKPEQKSESPEPSIQVAESKPDTPTAATDELLPDEDTNHNTSLPSVPDQPSPPPPPPDLSTYPDKQSRKQAEKNFKQACKDYARAVKARDKAIKNRQKALEKQQRKAAKLERKRAALHKPPPPSSPAEAGHGDHTTNPPNASSDKNEKPPRLRKFCVLPAKSDVTGLRDPTWVEVYMEGVDEVGAHCGLFLPGQHYERLVGDVGERIAGWVWEEASRRVIVEEEGRRETGVRGWDSC